MAKSILKLTNQTAAVKLIGAGTYTIALATDLLLPTEALAGTPVPTVNIIRVLTVGANASTANITRNAINIMDMNPSYGLDVDFTDSFFNETSSNISDIVVTITGNASVYLVLRKAAGYNTKLEYAQFGALDNPLVVGS